jgi:hypothetical protein
MPSASDLYDYSSFPGLRPSTVTTSTTGLPPDLKGPLGADLASALHGQLPPDVINLIQQRGAEAGVASGLPGAGISQNRTLRDLGLTSLNRMDAASALLAQYAFPKVQQQFREPSGTPGLANPWQLPETRAPLLQQPPRPEPFARPVPSPFTGNVGQPDVGMELMKKYGPGAGFGMAPMGSGTIPGVGVNWNAGPLDIGGGNMFMGDPSQLSPEELFAYGLDQPVTSPMSADEADYLYGDTAQFAPVGDEDISYFGG